ncbi:hypothetical protein AGMMS49944_05480 [Spirochaetia bacterium]|nr:hypothetical protein AGMMS49944_05480 [Spirochaetia bacterium]
MEDPEKTDPRIGNRSDALDLCNALIALVKNDQDKKGLKLWYALKTLKDAIERGIL